jgi:hypothetical protein
MSDDVMVSCHTCGSPLNHGRTSLPGGPGALLAHLGVPIRELKGATGIEMLPRLVSAIRQLRDEDEQSELRKQFDADYDPSKPGSWSRVDFALPFLESLRDGFCRDPRATLVVL